eukprot:Nk52_evm22s2325 gene=Nk52_evmTU22s2325
MKLVPGVILVVFLLFHTCANVQAIPSLPEPLSPVALFEKLLPVDRRDSSWVNNYITDSFFCGHEDSKSETVSYSDAECERVVKHCEKFMNDHHDKIPTVEEAMQYEALLNVAGYEEFAFGCGKCKAARGKEFQLVYVTGTSALSSGDKKEDSEEESAERRVVRAPFCARPIDGCVEYDIDSLATGEYSDDVCKTCSPHREPQGKDKGECGSCIKGFKAVGTGVKQVCEEIIDCEVGPWSEWTTCDRECDEGSQSRTRNITVHPKHGGKECPPLQEDQSCVIKPCPIDCKVGNWTEWGKCSEPCGGGAQNRTRDMTTEPEHGGEKCPPLLETQTCNEDPCPINCEVGNWTEWGKCSETCGGGMQNRTREITTHRQNGGEPCPDLIDDQSCNEQPCPIHCNVSDWSSWSECSVKCGNGTQTRSRTIIRKHAHGGNECPDPDDLTQTKKCIQKPCKVDCVSEWSEWSSKCDQRECGEETKTRTKKIITPPAHGGTECGNLTQTVSCEHPACTCLVMPGQEHPYTSYTLHLVKDMKEGTYHSEPMTMCGEHAKSIKGMSVSVFLWGPGGDSHAHFRLINSEGDTEHIKSTSFLENARISLAGYGGDFKVEGIKDIGINTPQMYVTLAGVGTKEHDVNYGPSVMLQANGRAPHYAHTTTIQLHAGQTETNLGRVRAFTGEVMLFGPSVNDHLMMQLGTDGNGDMIRGANYRALAKGGRGIYAKVDTLGQNFDDYNIIVKHEAPSHDGLVTMTLVGAGPPVDKWTGEKEIQTAFYKNIPLLPYQGGPKRYFQLYLEERLTAYLYMSGVNKKGGSENDACEESAAMFRFYITDEGNAVEFVSGSGDFQVQNIESKVLPGNQILFKLQNLSRCSHNQAVDIRVYGAMSVTAREEPTPGPVYDTNAKCRELLEICSDNQPCCAGSSSPSSSPTCGEHQRAATVKYTYPKRCCKTAGQGCEDNLQCCYGAKCLNRKCVACGEHGAQCTSTSQCCEGHRCAGINDKKGTCAVMAVTAPPKGFQNLLDQCNDNHECQIQPSQGTEYGTTLNNNATCAGNPKRCCFGKDIPCKRHNECCLNSHCENGLCKECSGYGKGCGGSSKCCFGLKCFDGICYQRRTPEMIKRADSVSPTLDEEEVEAVNIVVRTLHKKYMELDMEDQAIQSSLSPLHNKMRPIQDEIERLHSKLAPLQNQILPLEERKERLISQRESLNKKYKEVVDIEETIRINAMKKRELEEVIEVKKRERDAIIHEIIDLTKS